MVPTLYHNSMKRFYIRLLKITLGLFLFSLGLVLTIRANIGYAPWDVFHAGIAVTFGISIGTASVIIGFILLVIIKLCKEEIGLGTIINIILIGPFIDLLLNSNIIPKMDNFIFSSIMLIAGLFTVSLGSYFYMGTALGAGPRDYLMVILAKRTKFPVGACRSTIELTVTLLGWLLGGLFGIGTVISAIGVGFCIQITFRLLKFNSTAIKHESLIDTYKFLISNWNNRK